MMMRRKVEKLDQPVKHIFQQGPEIADEPGNIIPDIEDIAEEIENLLLNKEIGIQT